MFNFQSSILAVGYVVCQSLFIRRQLFEIDNKSFEKWRSMIIYSPIQATKIFENTFVLPPNFQNEILPISAPIYQQPLESDSSSFSQVYGPLTAEEVSEINFMK